MFNVSKARPSTSPVRLPYFDGSGLIRKIENIMQSRFGYDQTNYRASIQELTQIVGLTLAEWNAAKAGRYLLKNQYQYNALLNVYQQVISNGGDAQC